MECQSLFFIHLALAKLLFEHRCQPIQVLVVIRVVKWMLLEEIVKLSVLLVFEMLHGISNYGLHNKNQQYVKLLFLLSPLFFYLMILLYFWQTLATLLIFMYL